MGLEQSHVLSRDGVAFAVAQSAFDTMVRPVAGDGFKYKSWSVTPTMERIERNDNRPSRGSVSGISGMRAYDYALACDYNPSGTAGAACDLSELIRAAFGQRTINVGTSVVYALTTTQQFPIIGLHGLFSGIKLQSLVGAWVGKMKWAASGPQPLKVTFEGGCRRRPLTIPGALDGEATADTEIAVEAGQHNRYAVDSLIRIGAQTNAGTGFRVISRDGVNLELDAAVTAADGAAILPFLPDATTLGQPLAGIDGSLTLDGETLEVVGIDWEIDAGLEALKDMLFARYVPDVLTRWRKITGVINMRMRRDHLTHLVNAQQQDDNWTAPELYPLLATYGGGAGSTVVANFPRVELGMFPVEVPEDGAEVTVAVPFTARASAENANDELTLTMT